MVMSVNTNVGAMIALQNLNATNAQLATTQNRINTGKSVANAKDNGAIWAIAQGQRAEIGALNAVKQSLDRGVAAVDVALAAGETVSDLLLQMKEKALAATDASLTTSARAALNEDFKALRDQIASVTTNAEFNGINLLETGATGFQALANAQGTSTLTVGAEVMGPGQHDGIRRHHAVDRNPDQGDGFAFRRQQFHRRRLGREALPASSWRRWRSRLRTGTRSRKGPTG